MDKIAVVIDNVHDQTLMARLLGVRNYRFFAQCEWLCKSNEKFWSIIICKSTSQQTPMQSVPSSHINSRIIVLSNRIDEDVIVETLTAGAHYYFDLRDSERVLEARIDAALKRHLQHESRDLDVAPYIFKADTRAVFHGKRMLNLNPREFDLAYYLFSNRGRVVSDSELMTSVWTLPPWQDKRRIDTSICRIKKKMNLNTAQSKWKIMRLFKQGYQILC